MIRRFLGWWLWLANARMGSTISRETKDRAYAVKDRLLRRFGRLIGEDIQHIVRVCYTCEGSGWYEHGDPCRRCGGTGIWSERWFRLERWQLGNRVFHRPVGPMARPMNGMVTIEGRIYHEDTRGRASTEAFLWLMLFMSPAVWWREMTHGGRYCGWQFRPMLALQVVVAELRRLVDRFTPRRCYCGRRWIVGFGGPGWMICYYCRGERPEKPRSVFSGFRPGAFAAPVEDDLPF